MIAGFRVLGEMANIEIIAKGRSIRILRYLNKQFGKGNWRNLKGEAFVERISSGRIRVAEIHWYEAHGIGKRNGKIKRWLD